MNVDRLRELNDLFEHRNDALILLCLAEAVAEADGQPLHFRELARSIIQQTGTYVADGSLSRSLPRLKDNKLVTVEGEDTRHPAYRPTALGQQKAGLLAFILQAIDNRYDENPNDHDDPEDHNRSGAPGP